MGPRLRGGLTRRACIGSSWCGGGGDGSWVWITSGGWVSGRLGGLFVLYLGIEMGTTISMSLTNVFLCFVNAARRQKQE